MMSSDSPLMSRCVLSALGSETQESPQTAPVLPEPQGLFSTQMNPVHLHTSQVALYSSDAHK